jgi:hypothetical protein
MTAPDLCTDLPRLALISAAALVSGELVQITHAPRWQRPSRWPLPAAKGRGLVTASGHRTDEYRPIDLLNYVDKAISKPSKPRSSSKGKPETQLEIHA